MTPASSSKLRSLGRWLPGLIISAIAILLLIGFSDWQGIINAISGIRIGWLIPAILFFLVSIGLRAYSWMILLQKKAQYGRVFITLNEGYLLNNVFPFRLGELGRAYLLSDSTKMSGFFVLSTIVIERIYDLAIASVLFLATLPYVFSLDSGQTVALGVLMLGLSGLIVMFILARNRSWISKKLEDITLRRFVMRDQIVPRIKALLDGLGVLASFDKFVLSLVLMILSWVAGAVELILISRSFGVELEIWMVAFILGMISLGIAIPSAPAGLGVFEAAAVGAFAIVGLSTTAGLAIAIIYHMTSIIITGLIGVYGIFRDGESITGLYSYLRNLRLFSSTP